MRLARLPSKGSVFNGGAALSRGRTQNSHNTFQSERDSELEARKDDEVRVEEDWLHVEESQGEDSCLQSGKGENVIKTCVVTAKASDY